MLSIDWSPGADAAARCEKAKEDDFGSDLYVLQGLKDFFYLVTDYVRKF